MPAMAIRTGDACYCLPLQTVVEIVRPEPANLGSVRGQPTLRLRESVLPLVDLREVLGESHQHPASFAVITQAAGMRFGVLVDALIGQQEIVVKPLDEAIAGTGPFSGATIQEDGSLSLILDAAALARRAESLNQAA